MYGIQTSHIQYHIQYMFENDVKMYGIQTDQECLVLDYRLRMM